MTNGAKIDKKGEGEGESFFVKTFICVKIALYLSFGNQPINIYICLTVLNMRALWKAWTEVS